MGPQLVQAWSEHRAELLMPAGRWSDLPARTLLDIGSGMGDSLVAAAAGYDLAIGVDVHVRGLAATMRTVKEQGIGNLRLVPGDAVEVLRDQVPPGSLSEVHIWFPDPWPKSKHHKRRLVRPQIARLVASRLRPGGVLRLATDVPQYAAVMTEVLAECETLAPLGRDGKVDRPDWRPLTRYERFGLDQGRVATELGYRAVG
jgi:tRNA (guanine-N7-)-methyltransferase